MDVYCRSTHFLCIGASARAAARTIAVIVYAALYGAAQPPAADTARTALKIDGHDCFYFSDLGGIVFPSLVCLSPDTPAGFGRDRGHASDFYVLLPGAH